MRRVRVEDLQSDMELARTVFDSNGRVLLQVGVTITDAYITRLRELGVPSVYVHDEFDNVDLKDVVAEETRVQTIKVVKETFLSLEQEKKINIRSVQEAVDKLIDELLCNRNVLVNLADIRTLDDYTFAHSVNVCILSIMCGITMSYHELRLKELGIGALLHDIGKTKIDLAILNKEEDLTREEFAEIKRHCEYGFNILRQCPDVSLLSAHIAFQHHERWDGKGYPRQLKGEKILDYARIVATADVYDALMADRPYRPAYSVSQAITILQRMSGIYLDPQSVSALVANIAMYPIGSIVELNTGEVGIVVDNNKETPARPVLKIVFDNNKRLIRPHEIDLSKLTTIIIRRTLNEEDIAALKISR
ncbi:MAG: HD-GYP domain-containing protein [Syntrophomonadaceae bacterium]